MGKWHSAGTGEHDVLRLVLDLLALEQGKLQRRVITARTFAWHRQPLGSVSTPSNQHRETVFRRGFDETAPLRQHSNNSSSRGLGSSLRRAAAETTVGAGGVSGTNTACGCGSWLTSAGARVTPFPAATRAGSAVRFSTWCLKRGVNPAAWQPAQRASLRPEKVSSEKPRNDSPSSSESAKRLRRASR